jgi:hypothetical protein
MREKQAKKQAKLDKKKKKTPEQQPAASQQNQSNATQGAQAPLGTPNAVTPSNATATGPPTPHPPQQQ